MLPPKDRPGWPFVVDMMCRNEWPEPAEGQLPDAKDQARTERGRGVGPLITLDDLAMPMQNRDGVDVRPVGWEIKGGRVCREAGMACMVDNRVDLGCTGSVIGVGD